MRTFLCAVIALAGVSALDTALSADQQIPFTGNTTADEQLIGDAFQYIALYIRESLKCSKIELVEAEVLPENAVKRDADQPEGNSPANYERWTVTFCGQRRPFLVVFWSAKEGGTMYRIQLREGSQ